ncbi:putative pectinesterase/pectinesterase inhibitor 28 [Cinnamomum micranthum f. kanehirae]|uniref:Pectinesterase n=1 Tax=Cinnamomum micranthum f. kanehirae TaxID=337451 RepID=A0A443PWV6_9MAGN|nr:putative pectinesterase/pectinesterase inhibitor 28 [Cinnamomum micranthum f. kanehirae]
MILNPPETQSKSKPPPKQSHRFASPLITSKLVWTASRKRPRGTLQTQRSSSRSPFNATIGKVIKAFNESELLKAAAKDPRTSKALDNCKELMNYSLDDLRAAIRSLGVFDISKLDELIDDIMTWLSGSLTYQETCIDGFEGTEGDTSEKMKKALEGAHELTSNLLAIINEISSVLSSFDLPFLNRRLLSEETPEEMEIPGWVTPERRSLMEESIDSLKPNVTVAKDGSGQYKTINEALAAVPKKKNETFVIYIKEGVYEEYVLIEKSMWFLVMMGDGATKTVIKGNKNFIDGTPTFKTATVAVTSECFMAKDIGFVNTAGPEKHQAVALRVQSDRSIFYRCQMDGYQDTLYTHTYRQFYRECTISGTIDFIFGNSAVVFQNCKMVLRKPMDNQRNIVTAQGRKDRHERTAIIIQNCTITSEADYFPLRAKLPSYLGRPWKEYSRTFILQSQIDEIIHPDGWLPWTGDFGLRTCFYTEFDNRGPGAAKDKRVQWRGVKTITEEHAQKFTAARFIQGDRWIKGSGVPYTPGLLPVGSASN